MFVSIITDCLDDNAINRQASRYISYFNTPISKVGVSFYASDGHGELEAAGNLIDTLDAAEGSKGIVVVNTAPRAGKGKKWPNGTPFGYFYYKKTLVISTIDGYCLSLVKKLRLVKNIQLLDIPTVIAYAVAHGYLEKKYQQHIVNSQFRSYEFVPRVAKWLMNGIKLPSKIYDISTVPDAPKTIWWIDNFGNCVTTLLPEDIGFVNGKKIKLRKGTVTCFNRLKDVPNNTPALIVGSWGIADKRFLALIVQGKSAAKKYNIITGDNLF